MNASSDHTQNSVHRNSLPLHHIQRSSSRTRTISHDHGIHLRAKLRFFFMSPCWKWHLKRQFPWKAWFQFIQIIIVTAQVYFHINIFLKKSQ
jgi:hypothetical protein